MALAPGEQADLPWLAPSTRRLARRTLLTWAALALLLATMQGLVTLTLPTPLELVRRMAQIALPSLMFLAGPPLLVVPAFMLLRRPWRLGVELGGNFGLVAFMATALLWAGVGVAYAIDGVDPWDHMPWVTPPYLERFVAEHPELQLEKINGVYEVNLSHREIGGWLRLPGQDLAGSRARLERCGTRRWTDGDFGGLPLPPTAQCRRVLTLVRPNGAERVIVRLDLADDSLRWDALRRFYEDWQRRQGLDGGFSGGGSRWQFRAEKSGRRWSFEVHNARSAGPTLLIERGGRRLEWSDLES